MKTREEGVIVTNAAANGYYFSQEKIKELTGLN